MLLPLVGVVVDELGTYYFAFEVRVFWVGDLNRFLVEFVEEVDVEVAVV